jgi:hypothetical protein
MRSTDDGGFIWQPTEFAANRYSDLGVEIRGVKQWEALVAGVENENEGAFQQFLDDTATLRATPGPPRLFISHQQKDATWADRIACLSTTHGLDYWLDVHDPMLTWANGLPITGPAKALLIAGIIEMALLNCRYVIAVHTTNSACSKWIPYEFGRVKEHVPISNDAAGWYHPAVHALPSSEYFDLAAKTYGESGGAPAAPSWYPWVPVVDWIKARAARPPRGCASPQTSTLP